MDDRDQVLIETETAGGYRSLSGLAVASLVLGIASPVALAGVALAAIPGAAVVTGLWALARMRRIDTLGGRRAALWGLNLGLAFFLLSVGYEVLSYWSDRAMLIRITQQFAALAGQQRLPEAARLFVGERRPEAAASQTQAREEHGHEHGPAPREEPGPNRVALEALSQAGPLQHLELLELTGRGRGLQNQWTVSGEFRSRHAREDLAIYITIVKQAGAWRIATSEVIPFQTYLERKRSPGIRGKKK